MKTIEPSKSGERGGRNSARSRAPVGERADRSGPSGADRPALQKQAPDSPDVLQKKVDLAFGTGERVRTVPRWQPSGAAAGDGGPKAAREPSISPSPVAPPTVVQRKGGIDIPGTLEIAAEGVRGSGQPLPYLQHIQKAFGQHDVSAVRSFTGDEASVASRRIGAEAYTMGPRVAFRDANPSLHTVAHEAAHVIQQRAGVQLKGGVGQQGDVYERHADAVADAVVSGRSAEPLLSQGPGAAPQSTAATPPSPAVQRVTADDMGLLMAMAELEAPGFHRLMKAVATKTKSDYKYRKGLKSVSRSITKAKEYEENLNKEGDEAAERHGVDSMIDMIAGSLIFKNLGDLFKGYSILKTELANKHATIVRFKNRMHKAHLRDILMNIKMRSGFVVELQLHLAPTIGAKMGKPSKVAADASGKGGHTAYTAHDAYDYQRIIEPFIGILSTIEFSTYIDPADDFEKHELAKERTLHRYMDAGTEADLSEYLKLEPYKKQTERELRQLSTELNELYPQVMEELMSKAWSSLEQQPNFARDYNKVTKLATFEPTVRQDLDASRRYWSGMKKSKDSATTKKSEVDRLISIHKNDAKQSLTGASSEASGPIKRLKDLYRDLHNLRVEKKKHHPDTIKDGSAIDSLITRMRKVVTMLENREKVEKIVKKVKARAAVIRRKAELAKTKSATESDSTSD
jgi:hypothetical protein